MTKCLTCVREKECKIRKVLPFVAEISKCPKFKDYEEIM